MLLKLSGPALKPLGARSNAPFIARVTTDPHSPGSTSEILRLTGGDVTAAAGFRGYFLDNAATMRDLNDAYVLAKDWHYLSDGDVVRVDPGRGVLSVLYRHSSTSNSFLVTERCDNYCLMCSQPPKERDDGWLVDELMQAVPLISPAAREVGITGGEPALLGDRLLRLLDCMRQYLPATAVHILSNGRRFADKSFARSLAALQHPDLMIGIPLYADTADDHDFVVQAEGAFEETIRGILNLKAARVRVEIRFVIHAETYARLPNFGHFVSRNLRFVDHVTLMGLELMGFAKANADTLWIDPLDYQAQLVEAVATLQRAGVRTSIYNHQLCVLPTQIRAFARKSISDWKNFYANECSACSQKESCGGFFASSTVRRSRGIAALA